MGVNIKGVPVEAHNSIDMVKRYHGPIRCIYQIIVFKILRLNKDIALQIVFKAINDLARPNGLVPILLVFRAYPRIIELDMLSPTVAQKVTAIKKAMVEIYKLRAK